MHIEFKKLVLHNFMSFSDAELIFADDGFIRVSGINENPLDNARSNGSGKSSLWEAIIWVLTGETIRGTKNIVNFYGDDGCYVELMFNIDNTDYLIIRSKDHKVRKTNLQIFINNQDVSGKGIRDSEKLLQSYLPDITASLLGSVIILGQGLPQKFTNNTPSSRKEILEKLSKSDFMIEDLKTRVANRKAELQKNIRSLEDLNIKLTTESSLLTKQIKDNEQIVQSLDKSVLVSTCDDLLFKLNGAKELLTNLDTDLTIALEEQQRLNQQNGCVVSEKAEAIQQVLNESYKQQQPVEDALIQKRTEEATLRSQLTQIRNIKDVCPTCGQRLPDVHKPDTTELESKLAQVTEELNCIKTTFNENRLAADKHAEEVKSEFDTKLTEISSKLREVNQTVTTLKTHKDVASKDIQTLQSKLLTAQTSLAQIDATICNCNTIIRENNEKLTVISEKIMYNNKQRDLTQSRLDVVNKFDTALKRDFRGYLLSTVISFIEQRAKYYSKIIFDTEEICFCLNGNNIDINYMSKPYENLSGGEKQKIDLIIQFSIRDMLAKQLNFTSNILVLDEVFDGLDSVGCTKVTDMIASVSDIKNIFIVTHRKDLSIPSDKELIVVKSSVGTSEIRQ